jgi:hypothetical protein
MVVASSTDSVHWTTLGRGAGVPFDGEDWLLLGATPSNLVVFEESAAHGTRVWTSVDAVSWVAGQVPDPAGTPLHMAAGPAGAVAVGFGGPEMWFSEAGSSWQKLTLPSSTFKNASVRDVSAFSGGFVAAGSQDGRAAAWMSPDGRTWSKAVVEIHSGGASDLGHVYVAAHGLLAVGVLGGGGDAPFMAGWSSTDGRSWKYVAIDGPVQGLDGPPEDERPFPQEAPVSVTGQVASDGTRIISFAPPPTLSWIEPGTFGGIWESLDGATWQQLQGNVRQAVQYPYNVQPLVLLPDGLMGLYGSGFCRASAIP